MRIALHAFDGISMFHLAAPLIVFSEVGRLGLADDWQTTVWTESGTSVRTAEGLSVGEVRGPDAVDDADLLVFCSWPNTTPPTGAPLVELIRTAHAGGTAIAGLCLGAFPVADSGVAGDRAIVTHWAATTALAERGTGVTVGPNELYIDHGDVLTSAGTASAIDACLHVVRSRLGSAAAATVARHMVVAPHREGDQAQYVALPIADPGGPGHLGDTLGWASDNLDRVLSVDDLAGHAGMSRRHFTRRFAEVTGTTPARWLLLRRLDEARRLLETTTWSVDRIARACGFGSAVTLRQNFADVFATTPSSYRRRFHSV
ncbi:helix-turn-helix domain-containing protein [Nocardioides sp. BGMRC 2183]|nr:helix-turn-helix domain-containing protein [Nocardioides sp. BGMRC 2183]